MSILGYSFYRADRQQVYQAPGRYRVTMVIIECRGNSKRVIQSIPLRLSLRDLKAASAMAGVVEVPHNSEIQFVVNCLKCFAGYMVAVNLI